MENVTVMIVGARTLGRAMALHFAAQKARVAVMARTQSDVDTLVDDIEKAGGTGLGLVGDVTRREDFVKAIASVRKHFGTPRLGINAITPGGRFGARPFLELNDADLGLGLQISVRGSYVFLQELGRAMTEEGQGGCLVQVGTSSGLRVKEGFGALAAVQHAVKALTIAAAKELRAAKIHVVHLPCDGGIDSPKTEGYTARVGADKTLPQGEIARAVEYVFRQDPRAWTHEIILRPYASDWTSPV